MQTQGCAELRHAPSQLHGETNKRLVARLFQRLCLVRNADLNGTGLLDRA